MRKGLSKMQVITLLFYILPPDIVTIPLYQKSLHIKHFNVSDSWKSSQILNT